VIDHHGVRVCVCVCVLDEDGPLKPCGKERLVVDRTVMVVLPF